MAFAREVIDWYTPPSPGDGADLHVTLKQYPDCVGASEGFAILSTTNLALTSATELEYLLTPFQPSLNSGSLYNIFPLIDSPGIP